MQLTGGYSGWCYSRCGVVEVSMLWPCYPGKRESLRGMPGEEETLSKTHFALRLYQCSYMATNKEVHTQTDTHVRRHLCTNVNRIRRLGNGSAANRNKLTEHKPASQFHFTKSNVQICQLLIRLKCSFYWDDVEAFSISKENIKERIKPTVQKRTEVAEMSESSSHRSLTL